VNVTKYWYIDGVRKWEDVGSNEIIDEWLMDQRTKAGALVTLQVELVAAGTEERAAGVDAIMSAASVIVPTLVNIRTLTVIP